MNSEREHAEAVAREWFGPNYSYWPELTEYFIDMIQRERADLLARAIVAEADYGREVGHHAGLAKLVTDLRAKLVAAEALAGEYLAAHVEDIDGWSKSRKELRAKLVKAEAAAGQMRAALEGLWKHLQDDGRDVQAKYLDLAKAVTFIPEALATDAGRGYMSPEQVAQYTSLLKRVRDAWAAMQVGLDANNSTATFVGGEMDLRKAVAEIEELLK
jgi:hypothetical protein